jgi:prepilin-type N-terminal cleavage/methylation domain-containing protein
MNGSRESPRRGFSLVELLVVVAMILFVAGLVLPAVQRARDAAESQQTVNNLRQVLLAIHGANDAYKRMPPAFAPMGKVKVSATVHVHVLPFVEQADLYRAYLKAAGKGDTAEREIMVYLAKEDPSAAAANAKGVQNFAANLRVFSDKARKVAYDKKFDDLAGTHSCVIGLGNGLPDGTSNTILFATKFAACGEGGSRYAAEPASKMAAFFGQHPARKPADASDETATYQLKPGAKECRTSPLMAQSFTDKSLLVGMADGVARPVSPRMSAETWNRAMHPSDGFPLGKDWDE